MTAIGVLVDPKGIVLAPYEKLQQGAAFQIVLDRGAKLPAKVIFADPKVGLAILKIEGNKPFAYAEFADSDRAEVGDTVLALARTDGSSAHTVSAAIVSSKNRRLGNGESVLTVDSSVSPGLSSGLLVDLKGNLLGLLPKADSIGSAVPSNRLKEIVTKVSKESKN